MHLNKYTKVGLWVVGVLVGLFLLVMALSPVAKYVVNHYGPSLIGREMQVERVFINPFTGQVVIRDFHLREQNGETDFVAFGRLSVRVNYPLLVAKRVHVGEIHLDDCTAEILNSDTCFNFSDIVDRFASKDTMTLDTVAQDTMPSSWKISLDDIHLRNGHLVYHDVVRDHRWAVDNINLHVPGLHFGSEQSNAGLAFELPTGGRVRIGAGYVMASRRYAVTLRLEDVDSEVLWPLIQESLPLTNLCGRITARIHVDGGLDVPTNFVANGRIALYDVECVDASHDFRYRVDSLIVTTDRFTMLDADNTILLDAWMMHGGRLRATYHGGVDVQHGAHRLNLKLTGIRMKDFSGFTETLMAYPIKEGTLALESNTDIRSGMLDSRNRMTIDQLKIGNKKLLSRAPYKNIPLKTGVRLLQSAQGIIVLDLPVQGDVRSPKFDLKKIIGRVFLKVFFGPLMGMDDNRKLISADEQAELQELLGEDSETTN